jgi:hypothetical protein
VLCPKLNFGSWIRKNSEVGGIIGKSLIDQMTQGICYAWNRSFYLDESHLDASESWKLLDPMAKWSREKL